MRYIGKRDDEIQVSDAPFEGATQFPDADASLEQIREVLPQVPGIHRRGLHMIKDRESMIKSLTARGCELFV